MFKQVVSASTNRRIRPPRGWQGNLRNRWLTIFGLILLGMLFWAFFLPVTPAQALPAGFQEYYVLGNEEHGLAPEVAKACTTLVTIPGSGLVESLNVSSAAAVLCWEVLAGTR